MSADIKSRHGVCPLFGSGSSQEVITKDIGIGVAGPLRRLNAPTTASILLRVGGDCNLKHPFDALAAKIAQLLLISFAILAFFSRR